ncbi:MAG: lysophospholipid acyltransferase family protein [Pyrinomonadaceae bacterium]
MSLIEAEPTTTRAAESRLDEPPASSCDPTTEELSALTMMERFAFRFARRMNRGRAKVFWTWCQRTLGAGWIHLSTYNIMRVYGLEHLEAVSHERPVLLVANHRSFFDMYVVSTVLFYRTAFPKKLFFPVRGRFFYQSPLGMFVNFIMGWWSMFPPIFMIGEKRSFDKFSMRCLTELCRNGAGHIIGFHPEGTRNLSPDPYSFLRPQPGIGKLIKDAAPQVVPVFIAGLGNNLVEQVARNWTGEERIRIHFGRALDVDKFLAKRDSVRTYKEIADFVMSKIAELAEQDRLLQSSIVNQELRHSTLPSNENSRAKSEL